MQQVRRQVKEWDVKALSLERANQKQEEEEREQRQQQRKTDKDERAKERAQARLGALSLNILPYQ